MNNDLPIRFAGSTLGAQHHSCAFFCTPDWNSDDAHALLQYEANFNLSPRNRDPVICTYDLAKHSAAFIIDVILLWWRARCRLHFPRRLAALLQGPNYNLFPSGH